MNAIIKKKEKSEIFFFMKSFSKYDLIYDGIGAIKYTLLFQDFLQVK